ncbi:NAD-dependent epimerase/dehydratase family protein [Nostoc sp. PCC 7107]|uniref:NAD-dependent epimerase/dehydratase family protein n=1 Tax=Nostoc sp. PCC 7107 TaxID=317936 RepID=UPI00029F20B2|nr:NAD-dependent epimerase/dehydratase family protein [Nostoc sp. PCC 7107]AFY42354.1 UDP-glucose 4-epimerase [Nostoc sp. PCC 7107]
MNRQVVLVTGGCGFIGSHLVEELVNRGYYVRVLDNLYTGKLENLLAVPPDRWEWIKGDVTNYNHVKKATQGCDYVFHQAAIANIAASFQDTVGTHQVNYGGTANVLKAAHHCRVKRVIFASSAAVYGNDPTLPKRESMPTHPISPYGADKLASEQLGQIYHQQGLVEFVSLRYFNVFGLRQNSDYTGVISQFCDRIRQSVPPIIYGNGLQSRDFIHVSDVVQANLIAMKHPQAAGKIFNIGCGQATSLLELIALLNQITKQNLRPIFRPGLPGDIHHSCADNKAMRYLKWSPQVDIHQGLTRLLFTPTHQPQMQDLRTKIVV